MAEKMRSRKESLLSQVEARKLPRSAPKDANDVSAARKIPKAGNPPLGSDPSVQDIYEMLRQYEREIQQNHLAVNAAKQTLQKGLSFPEVYKSLQQSSTRMPDFEELIAMQTGGADWERSGRSNASAGLSVRSTADLNNYRGLLSQASRQAGLAGSRLESLLVWSVMSANPEMQPVMGKATEMAAVPEEEQETVAEAEMEALAA